MPNPKSLHQDIICNYPHLFKKLEWWEDRKPEDLPVYVRYGEWDRQHRIYKLVEVHLNDRNYGTYAIAEYPKDYFLPFRKDSFYPATQEEYEQDQKQYLTK